MLTAEVSPVFPKAGGVPPPAPEVISSFQTLPLEAPEAACVVKGAPILLPSGSNVQLSRALHEPSNVLVVSITTAIATELSFYFRINLHSSQLS